MKVKITTNRLPNKYPQGAEYEVEENSNQGRALKALVGQGEAYIIGEEVKIEEEPNEEPVEEAPRETVKVSREEIKAELKEKGIEFKGNAKTEDLKALLTNK